MGAPATSTPVVVRHLGEGPRQVLALHCTIAHSGAWRALSKVMTEVTFTAPDMLSHGGSPDWDHQGDFYDRSIEMVAPLLTEPVDVIGHSFGGALALRLAIEHPQLVRSLTLIEPVYFAVAVQDAPDLVALHDEDAKGYGAAIEAGDDALAARLFNRMWSDETAPRWPDLPERTRAAMTRGIKVVPATKNVLFDDLAGLLHPDKMARAGMPTLLLRGDRSHPVMQAINDGLARRLPNARTEVVPGAGHMLPLSHPVQTATAIRSLFADAPA